MTTMMLNIMMVITIRKITMTAMMAMMMTKISMMMVMMTKLSILSTGCGCSVGRQGALNHTRREGRAAQTEDKDDRDDRDKDDDHRAHDNRQR